MAELRLGDPQHHDTFSIPVEAVTQTFAIFGKRGSGKSNGGTVLAEEFYKAHQPFVVLDPVDAWWGLKSNFEGNGPGLGVYIFGGPHGDLPLQPTGGELMADVLVTHRISCVLSFKGWSGGERTKFVTAFAKRLLAKNSEPIHVFLEEADAFVPQRPYKGEEEMLGAMDRLIRWGRGSGIGGTLITQRSARVNKDVTTQTETLISFRTTGPQDRDAMDDWIKFHAVTEKRQEFLKSLPDLEDGQAWVWSPEWLDVFRRVYFRRRRTYDSAATPKPGEKRPQPKELAPVDLARLEKQMAATIEQAKQEDPRELRKVIVDLRRELASKMQSNKVAAPQPIEKVVERRVEVAILKDAQVKRLEALMEKGENAAKAIQQGLTDAAEAIRRAIASNRGSTLVPPPAAAGTAVGQGRAPATSRPSATGLSRPVAASRPAPAKEQIDGVSGPQQRMLDALAWLETVRIMSAPWNVVAWLSNQSPKSSGYEKNVSTLNSAGLLIGGRKTPFTLTDAGRAIAEPPATPTTNETLRSMIYAKITGPQQAMLTALLRHGDAMSWDDLAEASNQSPTSSGFEKNISTLRTLQLISGTRSTGFSPTSLLFLEDQVA